MIGYQINRIQFGLDPENSKPMPSVGNGCYEIRVACSDSWFRVFFVAKWEDAVYVLHSFQKKTNKTSKHDIELGKKRYKEAKKEAN